MDPRETAEQPPAQTDDQPDEAPDAPERVMPGLPDTGDARVDEAVRPLADLGDQPSGEHVEAYEQAHAGLQETLADLDKRAEDDREGG